MSILRQLRAILMILALSTSGALAQKKPADLPRQGTESFDLVNKEFQAAVNARAEKYLAAYAEAVKNGTEKAIKFDGPDPAPLFSPRFLAIAETDPEGSDAIEALKMTLRTSTSDLPTAGTVLETRGKAFKILRDYYVDKPAIKGILNTLSRIDDDSSKALLGEILTRNPDRKVQVAVYREKIARLANVARFADVVKDPKKLAANVKRQGQAVVDARIARAEKAKAEIEGLKKLLSGQYGDVYHDLSVGNPAPEIKIRAVDRTEATLSALKGKVVVLDIWATWCGPCRAMIPHEREMVERLKDKPFALVSISVDEKKDTLTDFLAKEKMPWTHWWNGMQGGIIDDWDVRAFPTIYVLDAQGVIRYKDIRGAELENAVNTLLAEHSKGSLKG